MNQTLFIKDQNGNLLEGPLSATTTLLIVLKEPNTGKQSHTDDLNCFWLKDIVIKKDKGIKKTGGTRFYKVLGAFAKAILNEQDHQDALKQCAYINLYPFKGGSVAEGDEQAQKSYCDIMKDWRENILSEPAGPICFKSSNVEILRNRLAIIKSALENNIHVAVHTEIFACLINDAAFKEHLSDGGYYTRGPYLYPCYTYKNKAKLYAIPHPMRRDLRYDLLEKSLGTTICP